jgi:hypothetical protein
MCTCVCTCPLLQAVPRGVAWPPADREEVQAPQTLLVLEYCDSGNLQVGDSGCVWGVCVGGGSFLVV